MPQRPFRTARRAPRGYILAFVLVMLLVLTLLAVSVLKTSVSEAATLDASRFQNQALINSNAGVEDGLARLRLGIIPWQTLPMCAQAETCTTTPPPWIIAPPIVAPATQPRYVVTIFQRRRLGLDGNGFGVTRGSGLPLVIVSSMGTSQDNPQYSTVIEVEVQMPSGSFSGNQIAGGG
jgi:hypothetical protein